MLFFIIEITTTYVLFSFSYSIVKVHICILKRPKNFCKNLHSVFDCHFIGQIYGGDFAKFSSLLRIYELQTFALFICLLVCKKGAAPAVHTVKRSTAAALKLAAAADDHDVLFATSPGPQRARIAEKVHKPTLGSVTSILN